MNRGDNRKFALTVTNKDVEAIEATDGPKPWERQTYDTEASWEAFLLYRDCPKPRRLVGRAGAGGSAQLSQWYNEKNWGPRAAAYDAMLDKILVDERKAALKVTAEEIAHREAHMIAVGEELATRELGKLLEQSQKSDHEIGVKPAVLIKLMQQVVLLRRLMNGQSTENVAVNVRNLDHLSDEELAQLAALEAKATQGDD